MKQKTIKKVCETWNMFKEDNLSTATLLEMVRSECNLEDASDVVEALIKGGIFKLRKDNI